MTLPGYPVQYNTAPRSDNPPPWRRTSVWQSPGCIWLYSRAGLETNEHDDKQESEMHI